MTFHKVCFLKVYVYGCFQNEGLKMTFHKRGRGRGRGGSSRYEIDAEKGEPGLVVMLYTDYTI